MEFIEKKTARIIEELTTYFFSIGATKIESKIELHESYMQMIFHANYLPEYEDEIAYLEECLGNEQKNDGMEDVFWELVGSGSSSETSQLLLISMLIDAYEIQKNGNEIELLLYKEFVK